MSHILKRRLSAVLILFPLLVPPAAWGKAKERSSHSPSSALYKNLETFTKVLNLVREDYVEEVNEKEMVYGAIRGMLSTLDPHSIFMPPDAYKELKVDTEGRFGGVGLEVTLKDNLLIVVTPIEGTPAERAGIREGDRILKIDGVSAKEMGLPEAVRKMRGARGSRVVLTLYREGHREPFDVTLRRDIIRIKSVRAEMPEEGFGYVRVASFQENTTDELQKAIEGLEKKSKEKLKGLIIDLRNNPGGLLEEAVTMSDLFLESGTIVSTASRNEELDRRVATKSDRDLLYPLVVMVNGGSASAAEIVAGALQDNKRAVILGTKSFGKGSVQTIFELGDGAALKLTIAKYFTPKGRSIQAEGIHPDIVVQPRRPIDLKGPLKPVKEGEAETQPSAVDEDYQKMAALDSLKKLDVSRKKP